MVTAQVTQAKNLVKCVHNSGVDVGSLVLEQVASSEAVLTSDERDDLYAAGINPIAQFPAEGIVIFGQKTLQRTRSALDRINVRRLMVFLKKLALSVMMQPLGGRSRMHYS